MPALEAMGEALDQKAAFGLTLAAVVLVPAGLLYWMRRDARMSWLLPPVQADRLDERAP